MIKIRSREEMDEFSLYCIVEGDTFTMPLAREEYILDVTTELQKNEQVRRASGLGRVLLGPVRSVGSGWVVSGRVESGRGCVVSCSVESGRVRSGCVGTGRFWPRSAGQTDGTRLVELADDM